MSQRAKALVEASVVFFLGADAKRDQIVITLPKALNRKEFDALQHAVQRATWKALTSRRRRKAK